MKFDSEEKRLLTAEDFWNVMLVPDYEEFQKCKGDIRAAFHAATSLFHMSDWVFQTYKENICQNFTFKDKHGNTQPVSNYTNFPNYLQGECSDFGLIRGLAHAAKHLDLRTNNGRPLRQVVQDAPVHTANVYITTSNSYNMSPEVMMQGEGGDFSLSDTATKVYNMWVSLKDKYNW